MTIKTTQEIQNIGEEFSEIDADLFSENEDILVGNDEFEYTDTDDE